MRAAVAASAARGTGCTRHRATRYLVAAEFRTVERGLQDLRGFGPTPVFPLEASLDALPFEP